MISLQQLKDILDDVLQLEGLAQSFDDSTPLLGSLPELDSMAVVSLLTLIEQQFGIIIGDDEIDAEVFETLGSLALFVDRKVSDNH